MTTYSCTEERFASDVSNHAMTVLRADGVERHLRFRKPGTSCYWFDILTWNGTLCIDGDCGTFVFRRVPDMFEFFRDDGGAINPTYWGEKCVTAGKQELTEFDWDTFAKHVNDYVEDEPDAVRDVVLDALCSAEPDEFGAVTFIRDFDHADFSFLDWEYDSRVYTFHFIWCLRAIVWAIQQWDAAQQEIAA